MVNFLGYAFLPFWILGVPVIVSLIILTQLSDRKENVTRSRGDSQLARPQPYRPA